MHIIIVTDRYQSTDHVEEHNDECPRTCIFKEELACTTLAQYDPVYCWLLLSLQALRTIQTDYEKRLKDVETQKEQLLDEMEARETTLINKVIKC